MKILLDPLIYWFADDENKISNLHYWKKVTCIIEKYFDIRYISSQSIIQTLLRLNKEPFNFGREHDILKKQLIRSVMSNLDYSNNIAEISSTQFNFLEKFNKTNDDYINQSFASILNYIIDNNIECLLFLSINNHQSDMKNAGSLFIVKHISGEVDSKITELIANRLYLKSNFIIPTLNNPLPLFDLCDHFLDLQNEMKKNDDFMSVFWRITKEVALRNLYVLDNSVTNKNNSNSHKRKIYTYKRSHYISADFESGCFELCDSRGKHQKEISYLGKELSPRDTTGGHDILI